MQSRPRRVALTGGIATGKSYCLTRFAQLGARTIDADVLARQAIAPGTAGFDAVRDRFGPGVRTADGGLDREALGRLVFADSDARRHLESIIHPIVYAAIGRWLDGLTSRGQVRVAIAAIPLLFETGHEKDFDRVIVTTCTAEQQRARLTARGGLTPEDAEARIAAQMPADEKAGRADFVIDTSGTFEATDRAISRIYDELAG